MPAEAARSSTATVVSATFAPPSERRSVLDRAHVGDIEGALGTVIVFDTAPRRSMRRRLATLLAIMGPGVVVMVADNDAGGLSIYAQAGQNYGASLLWVLLLLAPVLFINQEMVARLGAVTGAGHARLIVERFGRRWGAFAIGDLLILNALTIVTEFIGVALALGYFGVSRYLAVPIAAVLLLAFTATGSFRRWERAMYLLVAVSIIAIPLALLTHLASHAAGLSGLRPGVEGGLTSTSLLLIIALAGTTVAPWQLFFQQSNVVDKRITPRWLRYERADTLIGTVLIILGAVAVMLACAWALGGTPAHGHFHNAGAVAAGLRTHVSPLAGALFAIALLDASLLGAAAVTLASSYAIGDYFGFKHSLRRARRADTRRPTRADHNRRPSPRRHPPTQRDRIPAAPVQRPRRPRTVGQPALAEHTRRPRSRRPRRALHSAHNHHNLPEHQDHNRVPLPIRRAPTRADRRSRDVSAATDREQTRATELDDAAAREAPAPEPVENPPARARRPPLPADPRRCPTGREGRAAWRRRMTPTIDQPITSARANSDHMQPRRIPVPAR